MHKMEVLMVIKSQKLTILLLFLGCSLPLLGMESSSEKYNTTVVPASNNSNQQVGLTDPATLQKIHQLLLEDLEENSTVTKKANALITEAEAKQENITSSPSATINNNTASVPYSVLKLPKDIQGEIGKELIKDLEIIKVLESVDEPFPHFETKKITEAQAIELRKSENVKQQSRYSDQNDTVNFEVSPNRRISYQKKGKVITLSQKNEHTKENFDTIATFNVQGINCVVVHNNLLIVALSQEIQIFDLNATGNVSQPISILKNLKLSIITQLATTNNQLIATSPSFILIWNIDNVITNSQPLYTLKVDAIAPKITVHDNLLFLVNDIRHKIMVWDLNNLSKSFEPITLIDTHIYTDSIIANNMTLDVLSKTPDRSRLPYVQDRFKIHYSTSSPLKKVLKNKITFLHALLLLKLNQAIEQKTTLKLSNLYETILDDFLKTISAHCGVETVNKIYAIVSQYIEPQQGTTRMPITIPQLPLQFSLEPLMIHDLPKVLSWLKEYQTAPELGLFFDVSAVPSPDFSLKNIILTEIHEKRNISLIKWHNLSYGCLEYKVVSNISRTHRGLIKKSLIERSFFALQMKDLLSPDKTLCFTYFMTPDGEQKNYDKAFIQQFIKDTATTNPKITTFVVMVLDKAKIPKLKEMGFKEIETNSAPEKTFLRFDIQQGNQ